MDDSEIIALFLARDEQALRETESKYGKICLALANRILHRPEDAEECVNDTYLKLWDAVPLDKPTHFAGYVCQITRRLALNKRRAGMTEKRGGGDDTLPFDELAELISGTQTPEELLDSQELSRAITRFLETQKPRERQIFIRRYWFFDAVEEIAERFDLNPKTTATILFRLRKRLKKYLMKEGFDL